jgi:(1->4)-alpha-D-glucan 1-alpha-D-glucosylmutase
VEGQQAPSRNDEYLLYQTLIGSWPLDLIENGDAPAGLAGPNASGVAGLAAARAARDVGVTAYRERIEAYMVKATREAKTRTSWANPNEPYEEALRQFIRSILEPREGNLFYSDFIAFQRLVSRFGLYNGLTQTLCKLTAPGVPDLYQGDDLWDFSLVDPDNRRPVDYETRLRMLGELQRQFAEARDDGGTRVRALVDDLSDGRGKLYLIWKTLQFRRAYPELFREAEYLPLRVTGEHASKVCAFARRANEQLAIVIAPRLYRRLLGDTGAPPLGAEVWGNTAVELPREAPGRGRGTPGWGRGLGSDRRLANVLDDSQAPVSPGSGGTLLVGNILTHFPLALLSTLVSSTRQSGTR